LYIVEVITRISGRRDAAGLWFPAWQAPGLSHSLAPKKQTSFERLSSHQGPGAQFRNLIKLMDSSNDMCPAPRLFYTFDLEMDRKDDKLKVLSSEN
jgi:hypothetical protein